MNENHHILDQISDYVLNLLPEAEQQVVARHVAGCASCYQALLQERRLAATVRSTIESATRPDRVRLESLRPDTPGQAGSHSLFPVWQRQLAAIGVVLALFLGGLSLSAGGKASWFNNSPTYYRPATVALTDTPTMTATATTISNRPVRATAAPQLIAPASAPHPAITPVAIPARPLPSE